MSNNSIGNLNTGSTEESIVGRAAQRISEASPNDLQNILDHLRPHLSTDDFNEAWNRSAPGKSQALADELDATLPKNNVLLTKVHKGPRV